MNRSNENLLRLKAEIEKNIRIKNAGDNGGDVVPTIRIGEITQGVPTIFVSAEDGGHFANYYGQFDGEEIEGFATDDDPWIYSKLEKWAAQYGWHWEWENPGAIYLSD